MNRISILLTGIGWLATGPLFAADQPRGSLLELHSCELYAGGCIVSSEATLGGRYMLRVWNFTGGAFAETDLRGLQLAVLQASSENLAAPDADSGEAVVYLPQMATPKDREALLEWLKSSQPDFKPATLETRVVPLRCVANEAGFSFAAGDFVSVQTAPVEACAANACGEALWYTPRSPTSFFTVAANRSSQITEPLLKLKWNDAGRRSVFLGRFGENTPAKGVYVTLTALCGSARALF